MGQVDTVAFPPATPTPEPTAPPADPSRPQWLPEKFKSPEDLARAYGELEKKLGQPAAPAAPAAPATAPATPPAVPPFDLSKYEAEFAQAGALSDASYAELQQKHNVSKEAVDEFISLRQAKIAQFHNDIFTSVGGPDKYTAMTQWAQTSLPPAEQDAYNAVMNSGNPDQIKIAVAGLKARFDSEYGRPPSLVGGGIGASGPQPYRSVEEFKADMRDPRYAKDPAFQNDVAERLRRSNIL